MSGQVIVRGQNAPWPTDALTIRVQGSIPIDVSALLLTGDGNVRDEGDVVFYNAPSAHGVTWQDSPGGQTLTIAFAQVPAEIQTIRALLSIDDHQPALLGTPGITLQLSDPATGTVHISHILDGLNGERSLVALEAYRRNGQWKVRAVGQGWLKGLGAALTAHGLAVEGDTGSAHAGSVGSEAYPSDGHTPTAHFTVTGSAVQPAVAQNQGATGAAWTPTGSPQQTTGDVINGVLRAVRGIQDDLARSRAAYDSAVTYAENKRAGDLETAMGNAAGGTAAQQDYDDIITRAQAQFDKDREALAIEMATEETAMPLTLARFDSAPWSAVTSRPAQSAGSGPVPVDAHDDLPDVMRVGSMHLPGDDSLRIPLIVGMPGRPLLWVEDPNGAPEGPAWVRSVATRLLACSAKGTLDVQVIDFTGTISHPFGVPGPEMAEDMRLVRTPGELRTIISELEHQADLVRMAAESGVTGAIEDLVDGDHHLLVINDFPSGFDKELLTRFTSALRPAAILGVQIILVTSDFVPGRDDDRIGAEVLGVVDECLWLGRGDHVSLVDSTTSTTWFFDPEITPAGTQVVDTLVREGRRGEKG